MLYTTLHDALFCSALPITVVQTHAPPRGAEVVASTRSEDRFEGARTPGRTENVRMKSSELALSPLLVAERGLVLVVELSVVCMCLSIYHYL